MPDSLPQPEPGARLRRSVSLPLLTFYGVGTMVGGGFYALVGEVADDAGALAPLSVLGAALLALLSACSFAELASRYPRSAGEALYVQQAFGRRWLAAAVGWCVVATGLVSAAALANAVAGFLGAELGLWRAASILAVLAGLGAVAAWGIGESVGLAVAVTVVEVAGLVFVVWATSGSYAELPARADELFLPGSLAEWRGVGLGGFLVFYAFVGFEDMVNLAEEVREPRRSLPVAILLALALTTGLYLVTVVGVLLSVPIEELSRSDTPLALAVGGVHPRAGSALNWIGAFAGVNGALVQLVMASRVAYGMARRGLGPRWLGAVSQRTRTPVPGTLVVTAVAAALALWLPLEELARATSGILLVVFLAVNLSLWVIQGRGAAPRGAWRAPRWVPVAGALACALVLAHEGIALLAGAGGR